jgi:segregation and condensation protein A
MTYHVKTAVFEGPLDLLLQLITKHQIEVTAIGLTEVVSEYLVLVEEMAELDIEDTSEFLLIAATLIQLKARSLLPSGSEIDIDDELALIEERDRLLSRLLACLTFKDVSAVLLRRFQEANRYVPRTSGLDQPIRTPAPAVQVPGGPLQIAQIAARVYERLGREPDLDHLDLELPSVENAIADMRARIAELAVATFEDLTHALSRPVEVAAYFLGLLELARWGLIEITQDDWLSDIRIRHREGGEIDLTSEWAIP